MESVSLLSLNMRMEEMETTLDVAVSAYECKKQRVNKTVKTILSAKDTVIEEMNSVLKTKIDSYEYTQKYLYRQLKDLGEKIAYYKINEIVIKNNEAIIENGEKIISSMYELEESYSKTLESLSQLKEYLINDFGTKGYVELNNHMNFLPKSSTNKELVNNAIDVINSKDGTDNKKQKAALQRLIEYIKIDNDFLVEINKTDQIIKTMKKLQGRLPSEIKYREKELDRTKERVNGNRERNKNNETEISKLMTAIDGKLEEGNRKDMEYYDGKIARRQSYIEDENKNLATYQQWLDKAKQDLNDAMNRRRSLQIKAETFDYRTSSSYIDIHQEKYTRNENKIKCINLNIESILDRIEKSKANIEKLEIEITGINDARQSAIQAWKEFERVFLNDYHNIRTDVERCINEVMKKNGL